MSTTSTPASGATTSRSYPLVGMTCGHCVAAVEREVGAIEGVIEVTADLSTSDVTVTSTRPLDRQELTAAIEEAGYELAS
jgi:copper ion binding protein